MLSIRKVPKPLKVRRYGWHGSNRRRGRRKRMRRGGGGRKHQGLPVGCGSPSKDLCMGVRKP